MDEATWLSCSDPQQMLEFLRGKVSDRKLRLLSVAFCRRVGHLLSNPADRIAVDSAELYADGQLNDDDLICAWKGTIDTWVYDTHSEAGNMGFWAGDAATVAARLEVAPEQAARSAATSAMWASPEVSVVAYAAEEMRQSALCRDVFGPLPFRVVSIHPAWLTSTVVSLAQAIYQHRAFDRFPVLADALEEAGCTSQEILEHCRGGAEHVRGCWLVDLLLGKE